MPTFKRSFNFLCATLVLCALTLGASANAQSAEVDNAPKTPRSTKGDALVGTAATTFIATLIVVPAAVGMSFGAEAYLGNIGGLQFFIATVAIVPVLIATASAVSASWYVPTLAAWGVAFGVGATATLAYLASSLIVRTDNNFFRLSASIAGPAFATAGAAAMATLLMPMRDGVGEE